MTKSIDLLIFYSETLNKKFCSTKD